MNIAQNITDLSSASTFEQVFNGYYQQLASFSYTYVQSHEVAEDIVQEMFSNIWTKVDKIDIRTNIKSYLYGATRNACLNYLKHQKIERKYEAQEMQKPTYNDVDFLELDELEKEIEVALNKMPERCREIFVMSRYEEKRYKEIAEELDLSIKTVENQMGKALKVMRSSLARYLPVAILLLLSKLLKELWG